MVTRIIGAPVESGAVAAPASTLDSLLGELDVALRAAYSEPTDENVARARELRAKVEAMGVEVLIPLGAPFDAATMIAGNPWSDIAKEAKEYRLVDALKPGAYADGTVAGVLSIGCARKGDVVRKALVFTFRRGPGIPGKS